MADNTVTERIEGVSFRVGGNQPFLMDEPGRAFWVESGHLDIFAVELLDNAVTSRTPFVTRVPAGAMCLGAQRLTGPRGSALFSFMAVPSMDAVITAGTRAGIASEDNFDLDATIWIDEWIARLSEFMVRGKRPPPRDAMLLDADPNVPYPAGSAVSAHHSDIIWATANRPMRFTGHEGLVFEAGSHPVPLSERTWFELDADTEISAFHTPTVVVTGRLWPAFDRFSALVLEYAALAEDEKFRNHGETHRRLQQSRRATAEKLFGSLGGVLGATRSHEVAASADRTPLQTAVSIVAESVGVPLDIPRNMEEPADPREAVEAIARASGIRSRGITLVSGWWRQDGPSFVGLAGEEKRPLALLSDERGAYRAIDPATGATFTMGESEAAAIERHGMMLHPPLPSRIRDGLAALLHGARGRGKDFGVLIAMAVLGALVALLTPVLTGQLLAEVIPRVDTPVWVAYLAALLLAAFGTATFDVVCALALLRIEGRVDEYLQAAVWIRLLSLPAPFFRKFTAGDLADRANGITMIRQMLTGATASAVIGGVFSIFSYALLFYYSWRLALCAGALLLVLIAATWIFARGAISHHRAAFTLQGLIDGFVFQLITGLSKIRMANAETDALARWAERYAAQKRETLAARRWIAGQLSFNSMFAPLATLTLFAFIWYMLIDGGQQAGFGLADFLSFNAAFGQFAAAMTGLTAAWTTVVSVIPLFERVQPILEAQPETVGGADPGELTGDVEFANVSFRYLPSVPNAVDRVSFHIRPGDFVAFVGPSGSGKSTLYRLLLGFEHPDSGAVFLDGHDLSSLDMAAVRSRMGVVMQNSQLAADSIFKNISSSSPSMTLDEAWEAARAVGLDDDIQAMPMGMHTMLPEGGGGLSGGQKQRLLIARALARKPRIVMFDEATSALDNRTQAIVQASLKRLSITRVVIAHRLTTVQDADRIYVLEAGRIVETGRYDDLMARDGAFAALARRQIV